MKSEPSVPLCYSCKFRREIPGDAHTECVHPATESTRKSPAALIALLGGRHSLPDLESAAKLKIRAVEHGIKMGWFGWPFNFDPTWLENCDGYTAAEQLAAKTA